jgi:hypothetical protein
MHIYILFDRGSGVKKKHHDKDVKQQKTSLNTNKHQNQIQANNQNKEMTSTLLKNNIFYIYTYTQTRHNQYTKTNLQTFPKCLFE